MSEPRIVRDGIGEVRRMPEISTAHRLTLSAHEWTWTQEETEALAAEVLILSEQINRLTNGLRKYGRHRCQQCNDGCICGLSELLEGEKA